MQRTDSGPFLNIKHNRQNLQQDRHINTGDGFDEQTDIGPLITPAAAQKINHKIDQAIEAGAQIVGGKRSNGSFFEPLVVTNVSTHTALWTEEIFGPTFSINRFDTDSQALALANDTQYGLAAYFFSQCSKRNAQPI